MTTTVAVLGAGGKMGFRVTRKLRDAGYDLRAVEIGEAGRERLRDAGIEAVDRATALSGAQVIVLAIPDSAIGAVAHEIVPQMDPGAMLLILDAAAPYAGALPQRDDVTYFIGHPCHPPLYAHDIEDPDQRRDVHGGVAPQSIVCALMQGPEEHYALGAAICEAMWSPIIRTHRVTLKPIFPPAPSTATVVVIADPPPSRRRAHSSYQYGRDCVRSMPGRAGRRAGMTCLSPSGPGCDSLRGRGRAHEPRHR